MEPFYLTQEDVLGQRKSQSDYEDHLPRYQGEVDDEQQNNMADGYTFRARYLNFAPMSKPPTAVSIIQPPLKDLYIKCRKQGGEGNIRRVLLKVIRGGLLFTFVDEAPKVDVFFNIQSMIYFEGLQFQMVRPNEKKPYAMFVPFDSSKITPKDYKSAFVLDKNIQFLAQAQHPPLLACVLRRPKGIKALDCHLFEFDSIEDVYHLQTILTGLKTSDETTPDASDFRQGDPNFNRGQKSDVIRTEYGDYAIYRGNQMELKDDFFRPRDDNPAYDKMPDERREERRDERRDERREDRAGDKKPYDWDDDSSPIDNAWRSVNKQYTNEERPKSQEPEYRRQEYGNQFIAHSRDRSGDSNEGRYGGNRPMSDGERARYDDRPYRGSPHLHPKSPPQVAEKPSSPRPMSPTGPRFPGGMYGGGPPPREDPRADPRGNQFNPRYGGPPPGSGGPVYSASNLEGRRGDRSSKGDEDMPPKPVAKVPPHLVAGIKVLPTNFNIQGVKLKPRSPNHEKGTDKSMDKTFSSEGSEEYDSVIQKFDQMISDEAVEMRHQQGHSTPRDRSTYESNARKNWDNEYEHSPRQERAGYPEKGRYNYEGPDDRRYNYDGPDDRRYNYDGPDDRRYNYDGPDDRKYIMDQYDQQKRHNENRAEPWTDPRANSNRNSMPQMYERGDRSRDSPNRWSGSNKSQSSYEMGVGGRQIPPGVTPENPDHNNRKKDAEIANMFGGGRGDYREHSPYMPQGHNFEQSLGYYP